MISGTAVAVVGIGAGVLWVAARPSLRTLGPRIRARVGTYVDALVFYPRPGTQRVFGHPTHPAVNFDHLLSLPDRELGRMETVRRAEDILAAAVAREQRRG